MAGIKTNAETLILNMKEFIFASANKHKAEEIELALPKDYRILIMKEAGITMDIPEPFNTLEENSKHKAETVFELLGKNCFAEDTGLEVDALNNEPGVNSARYAGEEKSFEKNIDKLLHNLDGSKNRSAKFRTVFTLILNGCLYQFQGICEGIITEKPSGTSGFGYDPVFLPLESDKTFAEMTMTEKNKYSHRKKALDQMIQFLKTQ
jgi:XTP/dITP diphosphohydrolase